MAISSVVLHDPDSGSEAEVLVGFGFSCCRFRAHVDGQAVEVLWAEDQFASGQKRSTGSGIPLLFPFPGRIRGTRLVWEDQEYNLHEGDGRGNAIHGFVHDRPWRVLQQSGDRLVGQFQASVDDPAIVDQWPADYRITATYTLQAARLTCHYVLDNPDTRPLPCGFGAHPYFRLPLSPQGNAADCLVHLPVTTWWELVDMNATGKSWPLEAPQSFHQGLRFADMDYDNVFGGLVFDGLLCTATIRDPVGGRAVSLWFDREMHACVVYNPPHRQALCIEPYTCVPDCFRLQSTGTEVGLRVLGPGESLTTQMVIEVT
jgi:aldose 1-epimerase